MQVQLSSNYWLCDQTWLEAVEQLIAVRPLPDWKCWKPGRIRKWDSSQAFVYLVSRQVKSSTHQAAATMFNLTMSPYKAAQTITSNDIFEVSPLKCTTLQPFGVVMFNSGLQWFYACKKAENVAEKFWKTTFTALPFRNSQLAFMIEKGGKQGDH